MPRPTTTTKKRHQTPRPLTKASPIGLMSAAALLLLATFPACAGSTSMTVPPPQSATYYLDCSAPQNGKGTQASPWNTPASVNAFPFLPGYQLLVNRGTTCTGALAPKGSGSAKSPIVIDAYGTGVQPVINGGASQAALTLYNQQYWEINNLEIVGGTLDGVFVSGNTPNVSINHIYLKNLTVHGATYTSTTRGDSGEVVISTTAAGETVNDVLIDGVMAYSSNVSEGIYVNAGGAWAGGNGQSQPLGSNVTVQNSTAHDIYGDGILISELNNGMLQTNVVYNSGLCPNCTGSTPVGLWEWYCHTCTVQNNESYANQSWGGDGGDFDIDYYNNDNIVQYNYGHDSVGYCVAFFGSGGAASLDNIFRYNVCSNDGQRSALSAQGEVFLYTWDQGSLNGVQIYNNTFYWNPASNAAALNASTVTYSGSDPLFFKNNIIYATVPGMIQTTAPLLLDNNIYWTISSSSATWQVGSTTYTNFSAYQTGANQDLHGYNTDPMLNSPTYHEAGRPTTAFQLLSGSPATGAGANVCTGISGCSMGTQDFWGNPLPAETGFNIGAYQGP
ncbi:MAG: choice-of-anchor Q domain-containing protein [Terriglobales bacterium]